MSRTRLLSTAALLAALGGCSPMIWDRDGATQLDFNKDDYRCRREAMTGVNYTGINYGYGIVGVQGHPTSDRGMYKMCMQASGYTLRGT